MSGAFRLVLRARARLFETGFLKTRRLNHPVISVGNLTLGGTGKTPLVIYLAQQFQEAGFQPVILSRGYRRRSKGVVVVSRGAGPIVEWDESGDEPFLMASRLPGVAVVVGESRYRAGLAAEREGLGNLYILDDGFQHRQLHRDFDLVTVDASEWQAGERLIPAGRWREPKASISRADAACVQAEPGASVPTLPVKTFRVETRVDGIYRDGAPIPLDTIRRQPVAALAGIAKPERFFTSLESAGIEIGTRRVFRDHHRFTARDLDGLDNEIVITTEKDAVRLPDRPDIHTLRVSATIAEFDALREMILAKLGPCGGGL